MAKEKAPPPEAEDIPAWFMTYSDVITLLMTFFILLLTFATTEPERFEKVQKTLFQGSSGTGVAGKELDNPDKEAFVQRVRPTVSNLALQGSEMPPYLDTPTQKAVGNGLKSLDDEAAQQNVLSVNEFEIDVKLVVSQSNALTPKGVHIADMLAKQLRRLPVKLTVQCSNTELFEQTTAFVTHLYATKKIRPGQVGVSIVENLNKSKIRFSIERVDS